MELANHDWRPRRRRPPTRGLLFGASLDRLPAAPDAAVGSAPVGRPDPVPTALIGESMPVAPPRVEAFGSMAAAWPLVDRPIGAGRGFGAAPTDWASFATSLVLPERGGPDGGPVDGGERRRAEPGDSVPSGSLGR